MTAVNRLVLGSVTFYSFGIFLAQPSLAQGNCYMTDLDGRAARMPYEVCQDPRFNTRTWTDQPPTQRLNSRPSEFNNRVPARPMAPSNQRQVDRISDQLNNRESCYLVSPNGQVTDTSKSPFCNNQ